jgi:trimeric autotransporter adhesin
MPVNTGIYLRRGTTSEWTSVNPVLGAGEIGVEYNASNVVVGFKIGNGSTAWNSLSYPPVGTSALATSLIGGLAGSIPFQSGPSSTSFLPIGSNGQFLSVSGGALAWQTIDLNNLSASALTSGTLSMDRIASGAIVADKLASNSVTTIKIANGNVTADKLASNSVTNAKIENNAVTTAKIADANVTYAKIQNLPAHSVIGHASATSGVAAAISTAVEGQVLRLASNVLGFGKVNTAGLENSSVTETILANSAVTNTRIANGAVTDSKITDVSASKITSGTISIDRLPTVPLTRGGTGGTTRTTARAGIGIFVQPDAPTNPQNNDLWIW